LERLARTTWADLRPALETPLALSGRISIFEEAGDRSRKRYGGDEVKGNGGGQRGLVGNVVRGRG